MNSELLRKFFGWINERHRIYLKKSNGDAWPWTDDEVLRTYKFTNVFRQLDAVTLELTKRKEQSWTLEEQFFNIVVFRMFNWPPTYDRLRRIGCTKVWNSEKAVKELRQMQAEKQQVFTGAYIITNNGLKEEKIVLVCGAIETMWYDRKKIVKEIVAANSIKHAVTVLCRYPMVGKFIGYELATDLRHTKLLDRAEDIMTYANPGPGAKRGLNRIHDRPLAFTQNEDMFIEEMRDLLVVSRSTGVRAKYVPKLEMRDIEHSLCEFDKYMRVKNGEGRPRSKYRQGDKKC